MLLTPKRGKKRKEAKMNLKKEKRKAQIAQYKYLLLSIKKRQKMKKI